MSNLAIATPEDQQERTKEQAYRAQITAAINAVKAKLDKTAAVAAAGTSTEIQHAMNQLTPDDLKPIGAAIGAIKAIEQTSLERLISQRRLEADELERTLALLSVPNS